MTKDIITPLEVRMSLEEMIENQRKLMKMRVEHDVETIVENVDMLNSFVKEIETLMNQLRSDIIFAKKWKFLAYTYISIEGIPLYKRLLNIAKLFSEISAVQADFDILSIDEIDTDETIGDIVDNHGYDDLSVIPVITYTNMMDAVDFYNRYFETSFTVEDIFKDKEALITSELFAYKMPTDNMDLYNSRPGRSDDGDDIRSQITGKNLLFIKDMYLIDTYVFGDVSRDITLSELRDIIGDII